jgi:hypothetical protein
VISPIDLSALKLNPDVYERNKNVKKRSEFQFLLYRGVDKPLARPTSPCILFDGENISFDASLVIYINSTNITPIVIINRTYLGADKSLARPTSRCILCDGENISFDASLVIYIYIYKYY